MQSLEGYCEDLSFYSGLPLESSEEINETI